MLFWWCGTDYASMQPFACSSSSSSVCSFLLWNQSSSAAITIFYNTHEAIVEDAVFERVQELRANKRRPTKADRQGMFSGLVYCADCGSKLHFATCKSFNGSQDHYRCAKYKSNTGSCTAHFIREEVLKQIVWGRVFDVTALFFDDIMAFHKMMYQQRSAETEKGMKRRKREVGQARKRIAELNRIHKDRISLLSIVYLNFRNSIDIKGIVFYCC